MPVFLPLPGVDVRALLVDSTGAPLTVGGGTQYADGVTQATPTGNVVEWLDTANVIRAASAAKPLPVNIISGAGGSQTDASAWTTAVTAFSPGGGVFNDSAAALTTGQQGTARLTAQRGLHANLRTTAGADALLTNNAAAPASLSNLGALTALANAAPPAWGEGNQVLLSANLTGSLRTTGSVAGTTLAGTAVPAPVVVGMNGASALTKYLTSATAAFPNTGDQVLAVAPGAWDGTNWQKASQVSLVTGTTGVGLPATGALLWDAVGATNFVKQAGDGSGRAMVVGAAADNTAVTGNPVLIGIANTGGNVRTLLSPGLDGISINQVLAAGQMLYNGASMDRQRANIDVTLLASAARTTTQTSADITTYNCQAIVVTLDVTATVSTVSLTVVIRYKDPASGKYINLLSGTTVAAAGTTTYCVDPRLTAGTPPYTKTVPASLGRVIQLEVTVGNANSQTYSLGYTLISG
jgi:hypothetical protein